MADNDSRPSKLYMSLILSAIGLVGMAFFQADLYGNYDMETQDLDYLDVSQDVVDETTAIKDSLENTEVTGIQPLDQFIAGVYNSLKLLFGIGGIYTSFVTSISGALMIPGFFVDIIVAAVFVSIVFMIIKVITKWEI